MPQWSPAGDVPELAPQLRRLLTDVEMPPAPPTFPPRRPGDSGASFPLLGPGPVPNVPGHQPGGFDQPPYPVSAPQAATAHVPQAVKSDRSRVAGGLLNIAFPGTGRMYLGYGAVGLLQLLGTILTCGLLWLWPFIDGLLILAGRPKMDGYGRMLGNN